MQEDLDVNRINPLLEELAKLWFERPVIEQLKEP